VGKGKEVSHKKRGEGDSKSVCKKFHLGGGGGGGFTEEKSISRRKASSIELRNGVSEGERKAPGGLGKRETVGKGGLMGF